MEIWRQFAMRMIYVRRRGEDGDVGEEVKVKTRAVKEDEKEEMKKAKKERGNQK
jgi:hypothetical protein